MGFWLITSSYGYIFVPHLEYVTSNKQKCYIARMNGRRGNAFLFGHINYKWDIMCLWKIYYLALTLRLNIAFKFPWSHRPHSVNL